MAPELIQEKKDFDHKIDVYTFGVIFYQILMKVEFLAISMAEVEQEKLLLFHQQLQIFQVS